MTARPPTGPHERDDRWLTFAEDCRAAAGPDPVGPTPADAAAGAGDHVVIPSAVTDPQPA